jgi:PAS domain S-box-containing protein
MRSIEHVHPVGGPHAGLTVDQRSAPQHQRSADLLAQLIGGLRTADDPQSIATALLHSLAGHPNVERASIILVGVDGSIDYAAAIVDGRLAPLARDRAKQVIQSGLAGLALRSGRTIVLPAVACDERWLALGARAASGSAVALPLGADRAVLGVVTLAHSLDGQFSAHDLPLFENMAACASLAFSAAQNRAEEQSQRNQTLSLFAMSQSAASERSLDALADELLDKSGELFNATHVALFLPCDGALELADARVKPGAGDAEQTTALLASLADAAERAWRDRASITEVVAGAAGGKAAPAYNHDVPDTLLCVALPLLHNGAAVGVFALARRAHGLAVFSARVWSMLTILTNVAAAAFANRQMIDQLHRRAELLEKQVRERTGQLQNSRDLLRVVFDHLPDGLILLDSAGQILAANEAFCREVAGLPLPEVIGRHYPSLTHELEQRGQLVFGPRTGDPTYVARRICPAGHQSWYEVDRYAVASGAQTIERWRDMTYQEELRHQLLLHEQLASLGRLAASVVHEVGNPLQIVRSCLELCRETCELPEQATEYLDLAGGELRRMSHILAQLRDLYRPQRQEWKNVDLNELIQAVERITTPQLRRDRVSLELGPTPGLPLVKGQAGALHQVLLNLVLNAAAAMPDGGVISIRTAFDPARRLCSLSIADTGVGMNPRQLSQIFEPFVTGTSQGLGLGLYLSHQIIQQHRGTIEITSAVNLGTTVTVFLPTSEANDEN